MSSSANSLLQNQIFVQSEGVYSSDLGTETVLLHHAEGVYFGLKGLGVQIWPLLKEKIKYSELISECESLFETRPESLNADVEAFLIQLLEAKLIVGQAQTS
jgi:hypothetical protein